MDEVWKTVCEQHLPLIPSLPDLRDVFGDETPPRELMTSAITFQILHNTPTDRVLHKSITPTDHPPCNSKVTSVQYNALFSIFLQDDNSLSSAEESMEPTESYPQLAKRNTEGGKEQDARRVLVPPRYASYDTAMSDDNTKIVEEFMAITCQALPPMAFIDCNTLKGNIPGELLKKVEHISLSCHISQELWRKDGARVISSVLRPLLHHNSTLQHITFGKCSDERIHVITGEVVRLLTSRFSHRVERMSISVSHIGKKRNYGFCGNAWDGAFEALERKSQEASRNLGLMIPTISSLHTLTLKKWWTKHSEHAHQDHVNLIDVLCSFLKQPHFQCLALVDNCLPLVYIQRLVSAFLLSPCSQPQTLRLAKLLLTSRMRIIRRLSGYYPSDKEVVLPLTEWDARESQGSQSIISKAAREFKTLTIAFRSGGEGRYRKEDLATLEAARSWLSDLSHFKCELKSLTVHGDPCVA